MELLKNEKTEKSTVTLTVKVSKEEFKAASDKAFAQNVKKINMPGFRKGKAPRKSVEKMYGKDVFLTETVNICYPDAFDFAVDAAKISPVGPADVNIEEVSDENGMTFKLVIPVKPEVKLNQYKGLEAEKDIIKKADAASIKAELEMMSKRLSRVETVTRKSKKGDTVNINFEGFIDGTPFAGGKGDGFDLVLGSGQFIPGFEEQLVGVKAEESKDVVVSFPEDYHAAELAGKEATFKCEVNSVKQTVTPKIDDEFAKDVSEFDTLEELKADVAQKIVERKNQTEERAFEEKVLDKLAENLEGEIPQVMFDKQSDKVVEDFAYRIQMQGMKIEDYLNMNGLDMDSFRKLFAPQAEKQVKIRLALEEIVKIEKFEISDADVLAEMEKLATMYKMEMEQIKASVSPEMLKEDMRINRALDYVVSNATVVKAKKEKKDNEVNE